MYGRKVIMVFLDSAGAHSHIGDAERVRRWVAEMPARAPGAVLVPSTVVPSTVTVTPKVAS